MMTDMEEVVKEHSKNCVLPIVVDPRSKSTLELANKAARSNATILISGETGVGKELIARYIHEHSHFSNGAFVSVNCAALPENMIEAILFGYEKGAFTNAINAYEGKFEQAHNGTLMLDEISEIPIGLQAKLLRVLQEREIERLGSKKLISVNVRIIAATNRNLHEQVSAGYFRNDLYYRLNVVPIYCAALRDRPLDIIPLAEYFLEKHAKALGRNVPRMTSAAKNKLISYSWPGNVREMDNIIQRALIMNLMDVLDEKEIILFEENSINQPGADINFAQIDSKLKASEAKIIMDVLRETEGCRGVAARKLNISPRTLRYKISKLKSIGLKVP